MIRALKICGHARLAALMMMVFELAGVVLRVFGGWRVEGSVILAAFFYFAAALFAGIGGIIRGLLPQEEEDEGEGTDT